MLPDWVSNPGPLTYESGAHLLRYAARQLDVHQCLIVIYIYLKFHDIQFRGYLVIANYMDFKSTQGL